MARQNYLADNEIEKLLNSEISDDGDLEFEALDPEFESDPEDILLEEISESENGSDNAVSVGNLSESVANGLVKFRIPLIF